MGRPPKAEKDKRTYFLPIAFTRYEEKILKKRFRQSGMSTIAEFCRNMIFGRYCAEN